MNLNTIKWQLDKTTIIFYAGHFPDRHQGICVLRPHGQNKQRLFGAQQCLMADMGVYLL